MARPRKNPQDTSKPPRKRNPPVVYVRPKGLLKNPTLEELRYTFGMMKKALDFTNKDIADWMNLTHNKGTVSYLFAYHKKRNRGTVPRAILGLVNMWIALNCPINPRVNKGPNFPIAA